MQSKKYELISSDKPGLYRVKALKDFSDIKAGDVGGYVESEHNLSQSGNCWVYDNAQVYGNALVYGNAWVCGEAVVHGNAWVYDNARVYGEAQVSNKAQVYGNAEVFGNARIYDNAQVSNNAQVYGYALVYGNAWVCGEAKVSKGHVRVCLYLQQFGHAITATDSTVGIGCEVHTWEHWDEHIRDIGIKHGYTEEEIEETKLFLRVAKTQIDGELQKSKRGGE